MSVCFLFLLLFFRITFFFKSFFFQALCSSHRSCCVLVLFDVACFKFWPRSSVRSTEYEIHHTFYMTENYWRVRLWLFFSYLVSRETRRSGTRCVLCIDGTRDILRIQCCQIDFLQLFKLHCVRKVTYPLQYFLFVYS